MCIPQTLYLRDLNPHRFSGAHILNPVSGGQCHLIQGGGPCAVVKAACLESRRSRVRTPLWPSSVKGLVKIQYCEPP